MGFLLFFGGGGGAGPKWGVVRKVIHCYILYSIQDAGGGVCESLNVVVVG